MKMELSGYKRKYAKALLVLCLAAVCCLLAGCRADDEADAPPEGAAYSWESMEASGGMELMYANQFSADYYDNGCALVAINGEGRFLLVPEGEDPPEGLPDDIVVLYKPVEHIYLAASAAMDHFCRLDALDAISLSGITADGWYIDEAKQAMETGGIVYAGKYNMPDYELILDTGCELAIESTMISHSPKVKESLEQMGIPVMVDRSSYESHPLGRSEWIKLYGLLTGRLEQAEAVFNEQADMFASTVESIGAADSANDKKTVAFFYITSSGGVNVRKSGDYVSKMIEFAGGKYVFDDLGDSDTATATETIQMEEFYDKAKEADYLIYNAAIDGEMDTVGELLEKSSLLADFKAVKTGNVYCTDKNMYQETSASGRMISDIHNMLCGSDDDLVYLRRLK